MTSKITSSEIKEWSQDVKNKFSQNNIFKDALYDDSNIQKKTEEKWISENLIELFSSCGLKDCFFCKPDYESIFGVYNVSAIGNYYSDFNKHNYDSYELISRSSNSYDFHKACIYTYGINYLRFFVPNFNYVPFVIKNKKSGKILLLKKKIHKSEELFSLKGLNYSDFLSIFLQIVFALKIAKNLIGFTHYNLTPTSIKIVKLPKKYFIDYEDDVLLLTDKLVIIDDFEFSHISTFNSESRKISLGCTSPEKVEIGIFRDRIFPIGDIYKFLVTCLQNETNTNLSNDLIYLLNYFITEDIDDILKNQKSTDYNLPQTHISRGFNLEDFINYVSGYKSSEFEKIIYQDHSNKKHPIYEPSNDITLNSESSFVHFYDFHTRYLYAINFLSGLSSGDSDKYKAKLKEYSSTYIKGFTSGKSIFQSVISKVETKISSIYKNFISSIKMEIEKDKGIFSMPITIEIILEHYTSINVFFKNIEETYVSDFYHCLLELKSLIYITNLFWDTECKDEENRKYLPDELREKISKFEECVFDMYKQLKGIIDFVNVETFNLSNDLNRYGESLTKTQRSHVTSFIQKCDYIVKKIEKILENNL